MLGSDTVTVLTLHTAQKMKLHRKWSFPLWNTLKLHKHCTENEVFRYGLHWNCTDTAQKMKFSVMDFFSKYVITVTAEILNGKLQFLCSEVSRWVNEMHIIFILDSWSRTEGTTKVSFRKFKEIFLDELTDLSHCSKNEVFH